ncbi:hypothetical protein RB614_17535 [Phytohabitans sp. ZYX-F-186]|uniref:PLAT domain-containing protein n=1 Tax=Phytohabitans maris TaxID=3071409 RepID=A0ABU0ZGY1_9ACTN|nr:hypothetical protein [Phytohabitans sp. ZYX-F-186]MDQ7906318.1 hypothetical protein [Phytohabitans sp. ZYX-F-186]
MRWWRVTRWVVASALAAGGPLAAGGAPARADIGDETALAQRYAPVVLLVRQDEECGYGEPYRPLDVDVLFGQSTVALRGPWTSTDLVEIGPSAADLSAGRYEYHLDFPGNPLHPGCGYQRWAERIDGTTPPAVYAHVATDPGYPGKVALQYWFPARRPANSPPDPERPRSADGPAARSGDGGPARGGGCGPRGGRAAWGTRAEATVQPDRQRPRT